jgi:serine/threonine protein kinase
MPKLRKSVAFETTFGIYETNEIIGEGGAGRVFGGVGPDQSSVAVKVLSADKTSADKRRRFKNEITFLTRNSHRNIVTVIDHGISLTGDAAGPFYVMRRYDGSLRDLIGKIPPEKLLSLFSQILDGLEAAHFKGVVHRDLKPENILYEKDSETLAIADFGIARFTADLLETLVETSPAQRLANFLYAAPEQRTPGKAVATSADIYALGLILNEMVTGSVPHGTEYRLIGSTYNSLGFLDAIVARMISQDPNARPSAIADVKALIQRHEAEAVSLQRLSKISDSVIPIGEIDEPLAHEPPRVVGFDWTNGRLTLTLDRPVTRDWVDALHNIGSYGAVMGIPPSAFSFQGDTATVGTRSNDAQRVIDFFKEWLPLATRTLGQTYEGRIQREQTQRIEKLQAEQRAEEERLKTNQGLRI